MPGGLHMKIEIRHRCSDFKSYRAARVKSLFNVAAGCDFDLDVELPIEGREWRIGAVVGPSGSGKTSIGARLFGPGAVWDPAWPANRPIVDAIAPKGEFDRVVGALAAVGLGDVPAWLRPFPVLSNGERFRANLARVIAESPAEVVIDEFSSVVDRQVAKIGAQAFAKAWRRTEGRAVVLSCHRDVLDWLRPDWLFDTSTGEFAGRWVQPRPTLELVIHETDWRHWPRFEPHHYLKVPRMVAAKCYVGTIDGELVCHLAVTTRNVGKRGLEARPARLVVMPEWQGAGVGMRFLNQICEWQLRGDRRARMPGLKLTTLFHTSHPGLCRSLRRSPLWAQVSSALYGTNKRKSAATMRKSVNLAPTGFGGHFRAIQGFRYLGLR